MKNILALVCCCCIMLATCIASAQSEVQGINASSQEENLSTPEETWNQFRKALLEGNYDLAMEYCCPDKNKAVNRYKRLGKVKTSRIFKNIIPLKKYTRMMMWPSSWFIGTSREKTSPRICHLPR